MFLELNFLEPAKFHGKFFLYSSAYVNGNYFDDPNKVNCISRRDDRDKNLFVTEKNIRKRPRWNLFSQISIENDRLICANTEYSLTNICHGLAGKQLCTLLDTNEDVDIGLDIRL